MWSCGRFPAHFSSVQAIYVDAVDLQGYGLYTASRTGFTLPCISWAVGEPNNQGVEKCAELFPDRLLWNNIPCWKIRSIVCEYDVTANKRASGC